MKKLKQIILFWSFVLLSLAMLYPLFITFTNSLMSEKEIIRNYQLTGPRMYLIPELVTLKPYGDLLINRPQYLLLFWNSVKIVVPTLIGQVTISLGAAYAFAMSKFKFKELLFFIYILVMLLPIQVSLVPNYAVIQKLGLMNSYLAIILPGIFNPFGTFLLRQYIEAVPKDYYEAAQIDGANATQILVYLFVPIIKSGIAALAILTFIEYWNVVEPALVFIQDVYKEPLSLFLARMEGDQIGLIFAASCFYMLPPIFIFLYGQDYLIEGIQLSGVKG